MATESPKKTKKVLVRKLARLNTSEIVDAQQRINDLRKRGQLRQHQVLGSLDDFENGLAVLEQNAKENNEKVSEDPEECGGVDVDAVTFPDAIKEALSLAPEAATAILAAYKQLVKDRDTIRDRLGTLRRGPNLSERATGFARSEDISRLTLAEKMKEGGHQRALEKWRQQIIEWDRTLCQLARATNRPPDDLAMNRGPEWRLREEILEHLLKSIPLNKRGHGADQWKMGLRDAWERWVPVGSLFSGLFTAVYDKPGVKESSEMLKVGIPSTEKQIPGIPSATTTLNNTFKSTSLKSRQRSWADSEWLFTQKGVFAKHMKNLQPHDPDMDSLFLTGEGIEETLWRTVERDVSLDDVMRMLERTDADAHTKIKDALNRENALAETNATLPEAEPPQVGAGKENPTGPSLEFSTTTLMFHTEPNQMSESILEVANAGSTAMYYEWVQTRPEPPPPAGGAGDRDLFFLFDRKGVILPGHKRNFRFCFRSSTAGMFLEEWKMETSPLPLDELPTVALRGMAVVYDKSKLAREKISKRLQEGEKMRKVHAAGDRIFRNVASPPRSRPPINEDHERERGAFDCANVDKDPAVYYDNERFAAMFRAYAELREVLFPPEPEDAKPAKGAKGQKKAPEPEPEPEPEDIVPVEWDGSIQTLSTMVDKHAESASAAATEYRNKLETWCEQMHVPESERRIVQHSVWKLIAGFSELLDEEAPGVLDRCKERYKKKKEEKEQASDEQEGEPEENVPEYDPQEYSGELKATCRDLFSQAMGNVETQILKEKETVASLLDAEIRSTCEAFENLDQSDKQGKEELAWIEFNLWRKRRFLKLKE